MPDQYTSKQKVYVDIGHPVSSMKAVAYFPFGIMNLDKFQSHDMNLEQILRSPYSDGEESEIEVPIQKDNNGLNVKHMTKEY